jgi:hypothetical protein
MSAEEYEQAISFLRVCLKEVADEELEIILAEAEGHVEDVNRRVLEAAETAERLLRVDRAAEAVRFLDSQPESFAKSPRFREVVGRARDCEERLRNINAAVGEVQAAIGSRDWKLGEEIIERCRLAHGDHPELARVAAQVATGRRDAASAAVNKAVNDSRTLLLGRSYESALELLDSVASAMEYVPEDVRVRHSAMREEAERGLQRKRQESERTREQARSNLTVADTEKRIAWSAPGSTTHAAQPDALRTNDLEELTKLTQELESTVSVDELHAIVARARVLAHRHDDDKEIQATATEVATAVANRVESLTSTLARSYVEPTMGEHVVEFIPPATAIPPAEIPGTEAEPTITMGAVSKPVELPIAAGAENLSIPPPSKLPPPPMPIFTPESHLPAPIRFPDKPAVSARRFAMVGGSAFAILILALVIWKFWPSKPSVDKNIIAKVGVLNINSVPAGATVEVQDQSCVTPNCRVQLAPGDYEVKASLPGYSSSSRTIHVETGSAAPTLEIALKPLPNSVHISTNFASADVALDSRRAGSLRQGQLNLTDVPAGSHILKISARRESAELKFRAAPAQAPEIEGPISTQNVSALLVSNLAGSTHLYCNCSDGTPIAIDGRPLASVQSGRGDLGVVPQGFHQIRVGEGDTAHTHIVKISGEPSLDVFLDAERNVGVLVVQTGIENATVYLDGRKSGLTGRDGTFRSTLPVENVAIIVSKMGYVTPAQQIAAIKKNAETGVSFELPRVANKSKLLVSGAPADTSISLDGEIVGRSDSNGHFWAEVTPGDHTIELVKAGFQPKKVSMSFTTGKTEGLAADLKALPSASSPPSVQQPVSIAPKPPSVDKAPAQPISTPVQPTAPSADQQDWQRVHDTKDATVLEAFLSRYPSSPLADQARQRLNQLKVSSDRNIILSILSRYAAAYQHKSVEEVQAVWPGVNRKKISETFKSADTIKMYLVPVGEPSISADTATVKCEQKLFYNFGGEQKTFFDQITIRLRKKSGTWLIEGMS